MIRFNKVSFSYNSSSQPVLLNINLEILPGELVILSGPSGSGKSTLCRMLNGLIPDFYGGTISGEIEVAGLNPVHIPASKMATSVGMVFQDPENQLITSDVEHEICFGMENQQLDRTLMLNRLNDVLQKVGIKHLINRPINTLSGGEKQRIAIASILALNPNILVLDEPSSELDPEGRDQVFSAIIKLNREFGLTVVIVEHHLERVIQYADRIIVLDQGHVKVDGPPREVLSAPNNPLVTCGISIPPVLKLYYNLKERFENPENVPLTIQEGKNIFGSILRQVNQTILKTFNFNDRVPLIEMREIEYSYPNAIPALRGISLNIYRGEIIAIMGKNASGKTTLVKMINHLLVPDNGSVLLNGKDTRGCSISDMSASAGMVFQYPGDQFFTDTVEEEIAFGLTLRGLAKTTIKDKVDSCMSLFGLEALRNNNPRDLSGGEQQRLALASVTINNPPILILDEPTRGSSELDKTTLFEYLLKYRSMGNTVIVVSHDVETVAKYADRVVILNEGKIECAGETHQVLAHSTVYATQIHRLIRSCRTNQPILQVLTVDEMMAVLA